MMRTRLRVYLALLSPLALACASASPGQGRGGMPGGVAGGMSNMPDFPPRGRPDWVDTPSGRADFGQERADAASGQRLSKAQEDRAAALAKRSPADYELDRNGALVIRGEVIAGGLDERAMERLRKAGFEVLRQEDLRELALALAVVTHADMTASQALQRLRRLAPDAVFELNHVMFESASVAPAPLVRTKSGIAPETATRTSVGLIDTGIAPGVEAGTRVRLLRRNFAPGAGAPQLHGTAVAALLARAPGKVTIYGADIFGTGSRGGTSELLLRALDWMAVERVPVINISMVGPSNVLVGATVARLVQRGFTIVAPVGNDGGAARPMFPASYPGVVAVSGALDDGRLLPEASRIRRVDFVASGIAIVRDPIGRNTQVRGTSFAAPIVSRLLADAVQAPDPAAARQAINRLASRATRPRFDARWYGRGLVGQAAAK